MYACTFLYLLFYSNVFFYVSQRIGDTVIIPPRDARLQLYSLYKDGWVDVQEISKKSDFNPASTMYHWHANEKQMIVTAVELIYKSIVNLRYTIILLSYSKCLNLIIFIVVAFY